MNFGGLQVGFPVGYLWMAVDDRLKGRNWIQTYVCILGLRNNLDGEGQVDIGV